MKISKMIAACAATAVICTSVTALALRQDGQPDMQDMMQKWMEMTGPNEKHADMAKSAGTWTVESTMWMYPGAEPEHSVATSTIEHILDGRYLLENMRGEMDFGDGPTEFHGMNIIGYDSFKKKWVYCWVDNFTTGLMIGEGTESADGKTVTYHSEVPDPMTGKMKKMRSEMEHVGDDKMIFRMYDKGPDGHEYIHMEGVYTRQN